MFKIGKTTLFSIVVLAMVCVLMNFSNAQTNSISTKTDINLVKNEIKKYYDDLDFSKYEIKSSKVKNISGIKSHTLFEIYPKDSKTLDKTKSQYKRFFVELDEKSKFMKSIDMFIENEPPVKIDFSNISRNESLKLSMQSKSYILKNKNQKVEFLGNYITKKPLKNIASSNLSSIFKINTNKYCEIELSCKDKTLRSIYMYDNYEDLQNHINKNIYKKIAK